MRKRLADAEIKHFPRPFTAPLYKLVGSIRCPALRQAYATLVVSLLVTGLSGCGSAEAPLVAGYRPEEPLDSVMGQSPADGGASEEPDATADLSSLLAIDIDPAEGPAPLSVLMTARMLNEEPFPSDSTFTWDFGDGSVGSGERVSHVYSQAGVYLVTLTLGLACRSGDLGCRETDSGPVKEATKQAVVHVAAVADTGPAPDGPGELILTPGVGTVWAGDRGGPFSPGAATFTLANAGADPINWSVSEPAPWLSLSKTGGTLAPGASEPLAVRPVDANAAAMAVGTYTSTLTFRNLTTGVGTADRTYTLVINAPPGQLAVTPSSPGSYSITQGNPDEWFDVGPVEPVAQGLISYLLSNTGQSPLDWTAISDQPWLAANPASGQLAVGQSLTVAVELTAQVGAVEAGLHLANVAFVNQTTITGSTARQVSLTVNPPPGQLAVSPETPYAASGAAGGPFSPASLVYTLSNTGGQPANWTAAKTQSWLDVCPSSGTLAAGGSIAVGVTINASADSLAVASYNDTVTFMNSTNGNGNTTRVVSLVVSGAPPGALSTSPAASLSATGGQGGAFTPAGQTYTLTNTGGQAINWSASNSQSWVTLLGSSGTLSPGASAMVTVSINANANNLGAGNYNDTVTFTNTTNGNGNGTRGVSLSVSPPSIDAPVAAFTASVTSGQVPLTVVFDASSTTTPSHIADFVWDFADDNSAYPATYGAGPGSNINTRHDYGKLVAHRFANAGTYNVAMTATTETGAQATAVVIVTATTSTGTTYYVKNGGNDSADGLSDATAWATMAKANTAVSIGTVHAGDTILFRRGDVFQGCIKLNSGCQGTRAYPITFGAYGTGNRPELQQFVDSDSGIFFFEDPPMGSGVVLEDLYVRRTAWTTTPAIFSFYWVTPAYPNITIRNCVIGGGYDGFNCRHGNSLVMEDSILHGADHQGMKVNIPNVLIRNSRFYDNGTSTIFDHNVYFSDAMDSLVEHSTFDTGTGSGVVVHGVNSNIVVRGNSFHGNDVGIELHSGYASAESFTNCLIENNRVYDNTNMGIHVDCWVGGVIRNNLVYRNGGNGQIRVMSGSFPDMQTTGMVVANNVLYSEVAGNGLALTLAASSDCTFKNNIIVSMNAAGRCITAFDATGAFTSNHNLFFAPANSNPFYLNAGSRSLAYWQAAGYDANSVNMNPEFFDPANGEFALRPGSPCIGAGESVWQVFRDSTNTVRTGSDIGAYQH